MRKTKIKLHSKLEALEKLAQRVRLYKESTVDQASALTLAFQEIWARGSKAPLNRDSTAAAEPTSANGTSARH